MEVAAPIPPDYEFPSPKLDVEVFPTVSPQASQSAHVSGPRVFQPLLVDPTQVESKKSSQIQWPVPSINAEPVDIFLGEE